MLIIICRAYAKLKGLYKVFFYSYLDHINLNSTGPIIYVIFLESYALHFDWPEVTQIPNHVSLKYHSKY